MTRTVLVSDFPSCHHGVRKGNRKVAKKALSIAIKYWDLDNKRELTRPDGDRLVLDQTHSDPYALRSLLIGETTTGHSIVFLMVGSHISRRLWLSQARHHYSHGRWRSYRTEF